MFLALERSLSTSMLKITKNWKSTSSKSGVLGCLYFKLECLLTRCKWSILYVPESSFTSVQVGIYELLTPSSLTRVTCLLTSISILSSSVFTAGLEWALKTFLASLLLGSTTPWCMAFLQVTHKGWPGGLRERSYSTWRDLVCSWSMTCVSQ